MVKIPVAQEHQAWTEARKHINHVERNQSTSLPASFSPSLWIYSLLREKACLKDFSSHPLPSPSVFHLTASCKEVAHKTQQCIGTAASTKLAGLRFTGPAEMPAWPATATAPPPGPCTRAQLWSITAHDAPVPPGRPEAALLPVLLQSAATSHEAHILLGLLRRMQSSHSSPCLPECKKRRGVRAQQQPQQRDTICLPRAPHPQRTCSSLGTFAVAVTGK